VTTPDQERSGVGTLAALLKAFAALPPEQIEALLAAATQASRHAE
jgi:hypothetical protein